MENNIQNQDRTTKQIDEETSRAFRERYLKYAELEYYPTREDLRALISLIAHGKEEDKKYFMETLERIKPIMEHLERVLSNMYVDAPELDSSKITKGV